MTKAELILTLKSKLADDINVLNLSIREIMECSSFGIVDAKTTLAMRDHIVCKIDHLNEMIGALQKAELINLPPVTGPMARRTRGPADELTDADKELIKEAYTRYYPDGCPT